MQVVEIINISYIELTIKNILFINKILLIIGR
jgi:hypothetical protein